MSGMIPVLALDEVDMLAAEAKLALAAGIEVDYPLDRRQAVVVGAVVEAVGHVLAEGGGEEAGYSILRAGGEERPVLVRRRIAAVADAVRGELDKAADLPPLLVQP